MYKRCGKLGTEMFATYTFLQKRQHKNSQNRGKNPIVISRLDALIEGLLKKLIAREVIIDLLFELLLNNIISLSHRQRRFAYIRTYSCAFHIHTDCEIHARESNRDEGLEANQHLEFWFLANKCCWGAK